MDGWHFYTRPCQNGVLGWLALAKRSPFLTEGCAINEPGPLWFEFGDTEEDALARLKADLRSKFH